MWHCQTLLGHVHTGRGSNITTWSPQASIAENFTIPTDPCHNEYLCVHRAVSAPCPGQPQPQPLVEEPIHGPAKVLRKRAADVYLPIRSRHNWCYKSTPSEHFNYLGRSNWGFYTGFELQLWMRYHWLEESRLSGYDRPLSILPIWTGLENLLTRTEIMWTSFEHYSRLLVYVLQCWWFPVQQGVWKNQRVPLRTNKCFFRQWSLLSWPRQYKQLYYVDGVSLTHGGSDSRTHIWTFASGLSVVSSNIFAAVWQGQYRSLLHSLVITSVKVGLTLYGMVISIYVDSIVMTHCGMARPTVWVAAVSSMTIHTSPGPCQLQPAIYRVVYLFSISPSKWWYSNWPSWTLREIRNYVRNCSYTKKTWISGNSLVYWILSIALKLL